MKTHNTSWQNVNSWYKKLVGTEGHYYHEHVVLPGVLRLLQLHPTSSLLDLGCGQGILAFSAPPLAKYVGLDSSTSLIAEAQKNNQKPGYVFKVRDVIKPFGHWEEKFSHAVFMLSLQNMRDPATALANASAALEEKGTIVLVLNHPCFRIPRQSGWGVNEKSKQQYRWITRYLSPLEIPITMNPGKDGSKVTWSYHHSLQDYSALLSNLGLSITTIEEWTSDKQSEGRHAAMENRARSEFPLFLAIKAQKN